MAVGVLPFEIAWLVDFLTGGNLIGLAAYMFDEEMGLHMRVLSGFHLVIPPTIVWMLHRQGYDRRAWWVQIPLAWTILLASWWLAPPEDNINWVHGLGEEAEQPLPPLVYLGLYMALLPVVVIAPMHYLLKSPFKR